MDCFVGNAPEVESWVGTKESSVDTKGSDVFADERSGLRRTVIKTVKVALQQGRKRLGMAFAKETGDTRQEARCIRTKSQQSTYFAGARTLDRNTKWNENRTRWSRNRM